jgi:hypothetical protein
LVDRKARHGERQWLVKEWLFKQRLFKSISIFVAGRREDHKTRTENAAALG